MPGKKKRRPGENQSQPSWWRISSSPPARNASSPSTSTLRPSKGSSTFRSITSARPRCWLAATGAIIAAPIVAVSPDAGGVTRAEDFRARVGGSLAIISKQRPDADATEVIEMVGDVDGKTAVIIDDMISTASTLTIAADLLVDRGASQVHAAATHGVFAGEAIERIDASAISRVYVTDTIPLPQDELAERLEVVTVAPLLAEAIMRIHKDLSVSALFT